MMNYFAGVSPSLSGWQILRGVEHIAHAKTLRRDFSFVSSAANSDFF
jgi:hypothetical protein